MPVNDDISLRTNGAQIETRSGRPVRLRGVGIGGWMNMENFITGYPATETLQRRALRKALGGDAYGRFFDLFLDVFYAGADAELLSSIGFNCVRLPVNYRHFEDDMAPFEMKEKGFELLDRAIERGARHGLYSVIDLHALPGGQNQHWHSDNPTHWAAFWDHKHFQDRVVNLWEVLARRYRDQPWVAGYNLVNEPGDAVGTTIWPFYQRLYEAVRSVDPGHILFLDGNRYSTEFGLFEDVWPNTVYACHDYAVPGFVDGGDYPGLSRGGHFDRAVLERVFLERTEFMRRTGTPIWVGEFGPVYTGDPVRDQMRYKLLADQLDIYDRYQAGWSLWTYKDVGLQGIVYWPRHALHAEGTPGHGGQGALGRRCMGVNGRGGPGNHGAHRGDFPQGVPGVPTLPVGPGSVVGLGRPAHPVGGTPRRGFRALLRRGRGQRG